MIDVDWDMYREVKIKNSAKNVNVYKLPIVGLGREKWQYYYIELRLAGSRGEKKC